LRNWEDLYDSDLNKYSEKKCSLKTRELAENYACYSWGISNIEHKKEAVKKEIELDTDLDEKSKKNYTKLLKFCNHCKIRLLKNVTKRM